MMFINLQLWFAEYFKLATLSVRFEAKDLFSWLRLPCSSLLPPFRLQGILVVRTQSLLQILYVGLSLTELLSNTVLFTLVILLWNQQNDRIIYEGSAHETCLRLCWHTQEVTGSHMAVYSATGCTKERALLHVWVQSDKSDISGT